MKEEKLDILKKSKFLFLISLILLELLLLIPSFFSSQTLPPSNEEEINFPPHSLIGVMVSQDASASMAILKDEKTGKTRMLKIGEKIFDLTLTHVFENRIVLEKDEITFQVFLGRSKLVNANPKKQESPEEINESSPQKDLLDSSSPSNVIKREYIRSEVEKRVLSEWSMIMKEARFVPNRVNGEIRGFKITRLPKGSIASEVGIIENDIIRKVNGVELNDLSTVFSLYNQFKDETQVEVSIERNGKIIRMLYVLK